jgi:hypothetical protein
VGDDRPVRLRARPLLTDTEHDGHVTVLLSLLVAAVVLGIAVVRERLRARPNQQDQRGVKESSNSA